MNALRTLTLLAALAALSSPAFARDGNDGPSAMPPAPGPAPKAAVIAEAMSSCGFMCMPQNQVRGVRILSDGSVVRYKQAGSTPEVDVVIARIDVKIAAKLKDEAEAIEAGDLVDLEKGTPECMDAGTTTYLARAKTGSMVKIAQNFGCHDHALANGMGSSLVSILKGFSELPQ